MPKRLRYHLEPQKGWMNDPNGLCFFKGQYHSFFQHYPYAPNWGQMHWGHAVSEDLIHWTEVPIALFPDQPYEDDGGRFSGSVVVKDGLLYLFAPLFPMSVGRPNRWLSVGTACTLKNTPGTRSSPNRPPRGAGISATRRSAFLTAVTTWYAAPGRAASEKWYITPRTTSTTGIIRAS